MIWGKKNIVEWSINDIFAAKLAKSANYANFFRKTEENYAANDDLCQNYASTIY